MWDAYTSCADMEKFLKECVEPHPWFMAIVYNRKVMGSITLHLNNGKDACRAELGYVSCSGTVGKGDSYIRSKRND